MYTIGIDVGGTFTDGFLMDELGTMVSAKTQSTQEDLAIGVRECVSLLAKQINLLPRDLLKNTHLFSHGTTVVVNALLQYRGVKTGLITTKGFKNHLVMMRVGRGAGLPESELRDMNRVVRPTPIVPLSLTEEVTERVDREGKVVVPLDHDDARKAIDKLVRQQVKAIGVSLLWSFKNSSHEKRVRDLIEESHPEIFVTTSSELVPVSGEYERTATTVLNCYVSPMLTKYLRRLENYLRKNGLNRDPLIMQSLGGVLPFSEACGRGVSALMSGPAGGVVGSNYLAKLLGYKNVITTDMGGTSFDVGVIIDNAPLLAPSAYSPRSGPHIVRYSLLLPMIDITSIGSGGGSVVSIEDGEVKIGPRSAGSRPGPACYNRGGIEATVTDADLALGYISSKSFLGGMMRLSKRKAITSLKETIADPFGIDVFDAAKGIWKVTNSQASDLIRNVTVGRGLDPHDFTLFAFGGAGPIHCTSYGAELGMSIIIPQLAPQYSAFGVAISDLKQTFSFSDYMRSPFEPERIESSFTKLEIRARKEGRAWGLADSEIRLFRSIDMRYRAQTNSLTVPAPPGAVTSKTIRSILMRFQELYESRYGKGPAYAEAGTELTNFRIDVLGTRQRPQLKKFDVDGPDPSRALKGKREALVEADDNLGMTAIYDAKKLRAGNIVSGPSVIESEGTSVVVPPSQSLLVDQYLNFHIDRNGDD